MEALSRRDFFLKAGWALFWASLASSCAAFLRLFFPRVLFEPAFSFKAGAREEYGEGLSERWKREQRVWIVRTADRLFALSARCTHLGCTPNWLEQEKKFKCPCHGSGFYSDGTNFEGPAPRPLERFGVALGEDGQIWVDKSRVFLSDKGEWEDPESFLPV